MNRIVKRVIDGKICDCYEVGDTGKMRLKLEGTFSGDISRESLILVPLSLSETELCEIHDFWLTEQEFSLGLPLGESCSSAAFWVGSNDSSKDTSITSDYEAIIDLVMLLSQIKDPQDERIRLAKKHIYHTSQESNLLFWISAEFGYETQLSLCGQVRMQNKDDEDFLFYYPSIKDALLDWENELRDDFRTYHKEIAFIERLRSDSEINNNDANITTRNKEFSDSPVLWNREHQNEKAFYHVTLLNNVPSICAQGLIPQLGDRSIEGKETIPGIYLFPALEDMEDALSGWLGEWYDEHCGEDCALAILQVHLPSDAQLSKSTAAYEVVCRTAIPPECITVFDEQGRELVISLPVGKSPGQFASKKPLPIFTSELYLDQKDAEHLNKLLQMTGREIYDQYGFKRDETITNTLHFEDGYFLDVKVVICEDEEKPYIDLVLFDNHGNEIACDTGDDRIEGEVSFETDHAMYIGIIHKYGAGHP